MLFWAAAGIALGITSAAFADSETPMRRVSFGVEASREVANDWVRAVLGSTHEAEDPADVAREINQDVRWALDLAKKQPALRARTGGYRTQPIQDPKRATLRHWRGSQELILEGADSEAMSELIGKLQARLQVSSLEFEVSLAQRREVEEALLAEALEAFRRRAELVRKTLGASGYEIVDIQLSGGSVEPPPRPMMMRAMEANAMPAPALASGVSRLVGHAHGTIELR